MRTVYLSDEDFSVVSDVMGAAIDGQHVLIAFMSGKFGPDSPQVQAELARQVVLEEADRSLRGVSGWRGGGDKNPRRKTPCS